MEIVLAAVVAAVVAAAVVSLMTRRTRPAAVALGPAPSRPMESAPPRATATPTVVRTRDDEPELDVRRAELARIEERLLSKQEALDLRLAEVGRKEQTLED